MCLAAGMDDYISKPIRPGGAQRGARGHRASRRRAGRRGRSMTGGRVLVVDDTAFNRRLLVRLLTSIGHEAIEAEHGRAALDLLRDPDVAPVDVVLLDIVMPEMDGYETLAVLKADERLRDLPVIVISGVDELESVVRCIQMGAADYLPKTVDPEILRARIEASMAQKRLHDLERETLEQQARMLGDDRPPAIRAGPLPVPAGGGPRVERRRRGDAGRATGARSPRCSATCATSPRSPRRPNRRRSSGSCATYHGVMGPLIVEHEGTLEHFAGDGFMTFFNDPVLQPDHGARAVGAGGRDARPVRRPVGRLAQARLRPRDRDRHGDRLRDARPDRVRGALRLRRDRPGHHPRRAPERRGRRPARSSISHRTYAAAEAAIDADPAGDRELKGFSRPIPVYAVTGMRTVEAST